MKKLILSLLLLSGIVNATTNAVTVECIASVTVLDFATAAPYIVQQNASAQKAFTYKPHRTALVMSTQSTYLNNGNAEMIVELINNNFNFSTILNLGLNNSNQLVMKVVNKNTKQSEIHTVSLGNKALFSISNNNGHKLEISCAYGYFSFSGF